MQIIFNRELLTSFESFFNLNFQIQKKIAAKLNLEEKIQTRQGEILSRNTQDPESKINKDKFEPDQGPSPQLPPTPPQHQSPQLPPTPQLHHLSENLTVENENTGDRGNGTSHAKEASLCHQNINEVTLNVSDENEADGNLFDRTVPKS